MREESSERPPVEHLFALLDYVTPYPGGVVAPWGRIGGTSFGPSGAGPNGSKAKELYVRGRDVMDATFPVLFDDATMLCQRAEEDLFGNLTPDQRRTAQVLYDEVRVTP